MTNIYNAIQNLYNMDKETWQEVLSEMYTLVNNTSLKFDTFEQKFLLHLGNEVTKELKKMYANGSLASLINDVLLQDINEKVDTFKTEVSEQLDTITNIVKNFTDLKSGIYNKVFIQNNVLNKTFLISNISNSTIDFRGVELFLDDNSNCYGIKIENCNDIKRIGLNFNGNGNNQTKIEGYLGFGIYTTNSSNITFDNLKIKNTLMYATYTDNTTNITFNNPIIDQGNTVTFRNQDGLHFGGNTHYIYINNPNIRAWDDSIAFVTTNYTWDDISNIYLKNVQLNGGVNGIRFVMGDKNIYNVVIDGINGNVHDYIVSATNYTFEGSDFGILSNITIKNVNVNMLNKIGNSDIFEFSGNIAKISINNAIVSSVDNRLFLTTKKALKCDSVILNNIEYYSDVKLTSLLEFDNSSINYLKTTILGATNSEQILINNNSIINEIDSNVIKGVVNYGEEPKIATILNRKIYFDFFKSFTETINDEILIMNNVKDDYKEIVDNHIKFKSNFVGVVNISCYSSVQQTLQIKKNGEVLSEYQIIGNKDINYVLNAKQLEQISFIIKAPRSGVFEIKTLIQ